MSNRGQHSPITRTSIAPTTPISPTARGLPYPPFEVDDLSDVQLEGRVDVSISCGDPKDPATLPGSEFTTTIARTRKLYNLLALMLEQYQHSDANVLEIYHIRFSDDVTKVRVYCGVGRDTNVRVKGAAIPMGQRDRLLYSAVEPPITRHSRVGLRDRQPTPVTIGTTSITVHVNSHVQFNRLGNLVVPIQSLRPMGHFH